MCSYGHQRNNLITAARFEKHDTYIEACRNRSQAAHHVFERMVAERVGGKNHPEIFSGLMFLRLMTLFFADFPLGWQTVPHIFYDYGKTPCKIRNFRARF